MNGRHSLRPEAGRRGQALVEFSLTFPFFMLIMLALLQWSHMLYVHQTLQHAVREGARAGIVGYTNFGTVERTVLQTIYSNSNDLLPASGARILFNNVNATQTNSSLGGPAALFTIRVEYRYTYHTPLVGFFNGFIGGNNNFNDGSNLVVQSTFQAEKWNDDFL